MTPESMDGTVLKTDLVLQGLRGQIISGTYIPGARLPTFHELETDFGVSRAVVQTAVGRLQRDGYVRSINRLGLFVTDHPPHLNRYGLLFPTHPTMTNWPRFFTAMVNEASRVELERPGCRIVVYRDLVDPAAGREALRRLRHDVQSERLAGLIFNSETHHLRHEQPFAQEGLPKVFMANASDATYGPNVVPDRDQLYLRALTDLAARGRKRVAIIHMARTTYQLDHAALFAQAGLRYHAPWVQYIGRSDPGDARYLVSLLLDYPPGKRPDGLIIADDNLVEHVAAGLLDARVQVGVDLDVVAHCNWPWPVPSILPVRRIGFDSREMLRRAVNCIDMLRAGQKPPTFQKVPALFESELNETPMAMDAKGYTA